MAPVRPSQPRITAAKAHPSTATLQRPRSLDAPNTSPGQPRRASTKAHKRSVKHATLLSRLKRTAPGSGIKKRRRPSKKLVTGLGDLEDALPDTSEEVSRGQNGENGVVKLKQKSLKSRPGAMKRKEKLMMSEKERFAKNLALMAAGSTEASKGHVSSPSQESHGTGSCAVVEAPSANRARWAAIRDHIGRTMVTADHKTGLS